MSHAGQARTQMFLFELGMLPPILRTGYLSAHLSLTFKNATSNACQDHWWRFMAFG
jgi:hypothetical protein